MRQTLSKQLKLMVSTIMALAFLQIIMPLKVLGQEGVVVTLDRSFIERIVERNMQEAMDEDPRLEGRLQWRSQPRVEVQRDTLTALSVRMRLAYSIPGPNPGIDVHFRLGFNCWWRDPTIRVSVFNVDVDGRVPWLYRLLFPIVSDIVVNRIVSGHTQDLESEIASRVTGLGAGQFDYCPSIQLSSNGNVQLHFVSGTECRSGQTRHRSCPATHFGPGFDYGCINGYWEQLSGWCEPSSPPGGHPL